MKPTDIAKLLTEDLKTNNGLITEAWPESLGPDEEIPSNAPQEPGKSQQAQAPEIGSEHEFFGRRVRYLGEIESPNGQRFHKFLYLDDPNQYDPTPRGGSQLQGNYALQFLDKNAKPKGTI